jgi:Fe-S cluster biogenesis protein NfuA
MVTKQPQGENVMTEMTMLEETVSQYEYPESPDAATLAQIEEIIREVRPGIQRDGGDIELGSVSGDLIRVRLTGACTHCALAGQTLGGIRRMVLAKLGVPMRVLPVPID